MYDIIIKNGIIIDGSGNPWYRADVGIRDGKIETISRLPLKDGKHVIDAGNKVVAPGFCDLHTHSDTTILWHKNARTSIHAGVTTEAVGQCGQAVYGYADGFQQMLMMDILATAQANPADVKIDWRTLSEWREKVNAQGVGINIAPYLGQGTIRFSVMGVEGQGGERIHPTAEEMEKMKALVREGMEQGAFGLSTGLRYPHGRNCTTEEVIELVKVVKEYGGIYISHMRSEEDALIESARELIRICEETGVPGSMTHHKAVFVENWGKPTETMRLIDQARARGVDVICDQYPWEHAAEGNLGQLFLDGLMTPEMSIEHILQMHADIPCLIQKPEVWEKLKKNHFEGVAKAMSANETRIKELAKFGVAAPKLWDPQYFHYIVRSETHRDVEGKNLAEITRLWGMEDYMETAKKLYVDDEGGTMSAGGVMSEEDIITILKHPTSCVSTDSAAYDRAWDLDSPLAWAHPRNYGSFAKVLGHYARDMKVFSLEEAVRKMTSAPMRFLGIHDRGLVKEGYWADITIFDPKTVANKATYQSPCVFPEGIPTVLVNGQIALEDGKETGVLAGRVLQRA